MTLTPGEAAKACSRCRKVKSLDAYSRRATTKDRRSSACRECEREHARAYNRANAEARAAYAAEYYDAHRLDFVWRITRQLRENSRKRALAQLRDDLQHQARMAELNDRLADLAGKAVS
jgi:queuine/archaeosine tRNA-ribosyltransferase